MYEFLFVGFSSSFLFFSFYSFFSFPDSYDSYPYSFLDQDPLLCDALFNSSYSLFPIFPFYPFLSFYSLERMEPWWWTSIPFPYPSYYDSIRYSTLFLEQRIFLFQPFLFYPISCFYSFSSLDSLASITYLQPFSSSSLFPILSYYKTHYLFLP